MKEVICLSFATATLSFTVADAKLFLPLREWAKGKNKFLGDLLCCGYCFGHWVAFALAAIYRPRLFDQWWLFDYFLTVLVIAWLAAFQWIIMCWLMKLTGK